MMTDLYPAAFTDDDAPSLVLSPLEFGTCDFAEIFVCAPSLTKLDVLYKQQQRQDKNKTTTQNSNNNTKQLRM